MRNVSVLPEAGARSAQGLAGQLENRTAPVLMTAANGVALTRPLWRGFLRSAEKFADRPALVAEKQTLSYGELCDLACRIAATIQKYPEFSPTPLTAVFAYRTSTAFAGVLGALLAGNGYVPLNRTFPESRTQAMFARS